MFIVIYIKVCFVQFLEIKSCVFQLTYRIYSNSFKSSRQRDFYWGISHFNRLLCFNIYYSTHYEMLNYLHFEIQNLFVHSALKSLKNNQNGPLHRIKYGYPAILFQKSLNLRYILNALPESFI